MYKTASWEGGQLLSWKVKCSRRVKGPQQGTVAPASHYLSYDVIDAYERKQESFTNGCDHQRNPGSLIRGKSQNALRRNIFLIPCGGPPGVGGMGQSNGLHSRWLTGPSCNFYDVHTISASFGLFS